MALSKRCFQQAMAVYSDHLCILATCFRRDMLVAVDQPFRAATLDVGHKGVKAGVNAVRLIVDTFRGVVCDQDIDRWQRTHQLSGFFLRIQKVTAWFVPPAAVETCKGESAAFGDL